MYEFKNNFRSNLITDIDNGNAVFVTEFRQGTEDEIITRFYRLFGAVVRSVENRRDTTIRFFRVGGEALEIFNSQYAI